MRYIKVIQDMYEEAKTYMGKPVGNTEYFMVKVDDIVLVLKTPKGLNGRLKRNKSAEEAKIRIDDQILQPKESFEYLGYVIHKFGRIEDDGNGGNVDAKMDLWKNYVRYDPEWSYSKGTPSCNYNHQDEKRPIEIEKGYTKAPVGGHTEARSEGASMSEDITSDRNSLRIRIK
ncbi:hypothetical protein Tco_1451211 [Tanacetum coccineum]